MVRLLQPVQNIPKFEDKANWSRNTFQPMRRRACVYQQIKASSQWSKIFKTADGVRPIKDELTVLV